MTDLTDIESFRREIDLVVEAAGQSLADEVRRAVRDGEADLRDMIETVLADAARAAVSEILRGMGEHSAQSADELSTGDVASLLLALTARGSRFT